MRTIYDGYRILENEEPVFFAGANTGKGFVGAYRDFVCEEKLNHLWILKGGSGTGKSTLMRKIQADVCSGGHSCVRYLCSSDPDSLDAVVIDEKYIILDGTSPHVWEMEYPGAVSELIYLGKHWCPEKLEAERDTILRLIRRKKDAYCAGYACLNAVSVLEREQYRTSMGLLDREKLNVWMDRILRKVPGQARTGETEQTRTWAVTAKGLCRTDGLYRMAKVHWTVADSLQTAVCLMELLAMRCRELRIPVTMALHPVNDRITEVYIPSLDLHIAMGNSSSDKTICMSRFLQKEQLAEKKGPIRMTVRCMVSLLEDACASFGEAGRAHSELESVYGNAMDFAGLNRETAQIRKQIRRYIDQV